jgi:iron(III) transport system ATP-binding protein
MLLCRRKDNPQVEGSVLALFQQSDRVVAQNEAAGIAHSDRKSRVAATIAAGVSLNQVAKSFADHRAVDGVSLEIAAGEIICLLGPSGCGKTTLLRLIAGLDRLDSGRIAIGEVEVSSRQVFMPPEKRGVGLMFQDFALFPHMRVMDNVAFGLKRLGRDKALAEARAALVRMGLEHYAGHYPHMLSGGQQQRVALARAIVPRPAVLLMDEPFSGLDGRLRHIIREETLAILRAARATAILVTHDAEEAMRLGDRIAVMRGGRLIQAGTAEELYQRPADVYVAETFSEVHVVPCRVISGWATGPLGRFRARPGIEGEAVICVRPGEIEIGPPGSGVPASVTDIRFLGPEALVELAVQGLDKPLGARMKAASAPKKGAEIGIHVDQERALIFPRDASGGLHR